MWQFPFQWKGLAAGRTSVGFQDERLWHAPSVHSSRHAAMHFKWWTEDNVYIWLLTRAYT